MTAPRARIITAGIRVPLRVQDKNAQRGLVSEEEVAGSGRLSDSSPKTTASQIHTRKRVTIIPRRLSCKRRRC